ncbi:MAG: hypothetical protein GF417_07300 [Candidatus Latescibacteria bacterium]|nr:hypothetical protein [Candidatus Latescibacterota bacterium]
MEKDLVVILNLNPSLHREFYDKADIPEGFVSKSFRNFPRYLKSLQEESNISRTVMFLPGKRFNPARVRQVCLLLIDTPIFIVTDDCDEKSYLAYISAGVSRIITPPITFLDCQAVYNGNVRKPNEMVFGKSRELIREGQVRLDFLIPSKLSRIIGVNRLVSFLTAEFGFPPEDFKVNLPMVMDEALTNAIVHGNCKNPDLKVHVRIYISSHRIIIQIEDQGQGFDFNSTADPTRSEKLYNDSGRGIFIIREIMDKVTFKNGGRVIEMEKVNGGCDSGEK